MSNRRKPRVPSEVTGVKMVSYTPGMPVVVLERIEAGVTPDYCIHGRVTCYWCPEWCWLGDRTHDLVSSGQAAPICKECAAKLIPQGSRPVNNVGDHRRADGPH